MKIRNSIKKITGLSAIALAGTSFIQCEQPEKEKMNVLFIVVDDLNDWVGCFGGNPQVLTPNIDRFAENSMIFLNAQAPATVCGPSRSAFLTGLGPSTSGVYSNRQNLRNSDIASQVPTIPQYFSMNGYFSLSTGKIFHKHPAKPERDQGQWAFDLWVEEHGGAYVDRSKIPLNGLPPYPIRGTRMDWGPIEGGKERTKDWISSQWISDRLQEDYEKPFFMMLGISKPHLSWYVPQEYFDLYDLDSIIVPEYNMDDYDDILTPDGQPKFQATEEFLVIREHNKLKDAARAYMACVSYVDDCLGLVFETLDKSKYKDNTIVVIIGDHGWHLGEKLRFRKNTAWEESCRTPMIIHVPGMNASVKTKRTVNLLDLYPTLAELCNLPVPEHCDGKSFKPLIKNPEIAWSPTLTTIAYKNHSVRSEQYRYIVYEDGTEELYDHYSDPMEWKNLVRDERFAVVVQDLRSYLPNHDAAPSPSADDGGGEE